MRTIKSIKMLMRIWNGAMIHSFVADINLVFIKDTSMIQVNTDTV